MLHDLLEQVGQACSGQSLSVRVPYAAIRLPTCFFFLFFFTGQCRNVLDAGGCFCGEGGTGAMCTCEKCSRVHACFLFVFSLFY